MTTPKSEGAEWERQYAEAPFVMVLEKIDNKYADDKTGYLVPTIKSFIAHQRHQAELAANLRAFEVLHKYAMQTKDTHALNLIEAAQKEILGDTGENDLASVRQQAVAEFAREVLSVLDGHKVDDGISFEGDLPPADAMIAMMEETETIRRAVNTIFDMATADIHTLAKERGIDLSN